MLFLPVYNSKGKKNLLFDVLRIGILIYMNNSIPGIEYK